MSSAPLVASAPPRAEAAAWRDLPSERVTTKENSLPAGKWTGAAGIGAKPTAAAPLSFQILDDGIEPEKPATAAARKNRFILCAGTDRLIK